MPEYTYYAFRLLTGDVLTELPLRGASPSWAVNDVGDLGAPRVDLTGLSPFQRAEVRAATVPWLNGIAVDRDGTIIWSGVITGRRYASTGGAYDLAVPGLLAYWRRIPIVTNSIINDLDLAYLAPAVLRGIGGTGTGMVPFRTDLGSTGTTADLRTAGADLKPALDVLTELADGDPGFEFAMDTAWDATTYLSRVVHSFRIGAPRLGRRAVQGDVLLLEWPGNVRSYTWDENGEEFSTEIWGTTQTDEGVTMVRSKINPILTGQGFPRVVGVRSWPGVEFASILDARIAGALTQAAGYTDAPTFTVPDRGDTAAGTWMVGDDIRLRITDERRFPVASGGPEPGLDRIVRIQSGTLDPATEEISLTAFDFTEPVQ